MRRTALLPLLLAALPLPAQTVPAPPELEPVRAWVAEAVRTGLAPSAVVAVVRDDSLVWAEGFGYADMEARRAATPNSIYLLASVTKPMTATGLMTLVDRGLLQLDRPANDFLPADAQLVSHVGDADRITLRRLANHTGGLPLHYNFYYEGAEPLPYGEAIRRYGFAAHPPGDRWQYSNLAYGILEHVTELVAEEPWRAFMKRAVFDPLGMARTSDRVRPEHAGDATRQYTRDAAGRWIPVPSYRFDHAGASTHWSSALDLVRLIRMQWHGGGLDGVRILSPEAARAMLTLTGPVGADVRNGIGWFVKAYRGQPSFWHSGGMPGVSTFARAYPESRTATIVLTNSDDRTVANETTRRLAEALFPHAEWESEESPPEPLPPAPGMAGLWEGRMVHHDGDVPVRLRIGAEAGASIAFGDRDPVPMEAAAVNAAGFVGRVDARLRTQEGFHGIPSFLFRLEPDGEDGLRGVATAFASGYFALSHWVELRRATD
jgi:CubicO group peptidase (beta-lactamase class C family)